MTCKDCLHYKMCDYGKIGNICADFADKSEWVHLPCKVGDRVFSIVIIGGEYSVVADRVHALKISTEIRREIFSKNKKHFCKTS